MSLAFVAEVITTNGNPGPKLAALEGGKFLHQGSICLSSRFDLVRSFVDEGERKAQMCVLVLSNCCVLSARSKGP